MITVLLADDDVLVRQGLRVLVESAGDLRVVAEAADGDQAVELAASTRPDVVVMDVRMPGRDGIDATREISSWDEPRPSVLVLTTFDLDEIVHDALEAGADGFLLKRSTPDELIAGIRTVAAGDALISATLTRRLLGYVAAKKSGAAGASLVVPLTDREAEVLRYLTEGLVERRDRGEARDRARDREDAREAHLHEDRERATAPRPWSGRTRRGSSERRDRYADGDRGPCTPATVLRGRIGAHRHLGLEDALALLVGEASVDHLVGRLRKALRHRRVLARRLRQVPAVQQLIGERDPERRPGLVDDAGLAERAERVGLRELEVGDRVLAEEIGRVA